MFIECMQRTLAMDDQLCLQTLNEQVSSENLWLTIVRTRIHERASRRTLWMALLERLLIAYVQKSSSSATNDASKGFGKGRRIYSGSCPGILRRVDWLFQGHVFFRAFALLLLSALCGTDVARSCTFDLLMINRVIYLTSFGLFMSFC